MKTSVKRNVLFLISLLLFCTMLSFVGFKKTVKAESSAISASYTFAEGDFAMANGASVRIADDANGLRFLAGFKSTFNFENLGAFGMLIGPTDLVGEVLDEEDVTAGRAVDISYTAEEAAAYLFDVTGTNGETYRMFGGSLTNIYVNNYNRNFTAIAYYEKEGVRTYAAVNDGENVRSMAAVASKIVENDQIFGTYSDTAKALLESYSNKYQVQNGSFLYGMNGWTATSSDGRELGFIVDKANHYPGAEYGYMCDDYGTASEKVFSFVNTDTINEGDTQAEKEINHESVAGTLTSSLFVVKEGAWLTFSWGGGVNGDVLLKICKEDGSVVAMYDNIYNNAGSLQAKTLKRAVDLGGLNLAGETVYLVFEDNSTSNYGGIVVSDIVTDATECPADAMEIAVHGSYILNAGFEDGNLNGWTATEGEAFKTEYVANSDETFWDVQREFNAIGSKFFRGERNEIATGKMRSASFVLGGDGYISFLFGGNGNKEVYVQFVEAETGAVLKKVTNDAFNDPNFSNNMNRVFVDLHEHVGKTIYIEVVDNAEGGFGFANLDDFCVSLTSHEVTRLLNETKSWASGLPTDAENASQNAANEYIKNYYATYVLPFDLI